MKKEMMEWTVCIIVAVVLALLIRYFIGTPTVVKNISMEPTLVRKTKINVKSYFDKNPKRTS